MQPRPPESPAASTAAPDTSAIRRLISQVRRLLRSSWVATGAGVTLGLLFGILVAAALFDLVLPLPQSLRFVALLTVVLPTAIAFHTGVVRPLFRRLNGPRVARTIEPHLPGIHNRLVSVVDLDEKGAARSVSPTFHQRLVSETLERIRTFRPSQVINFRNLQRAGLAAFLGMGTFLTAYTVFNDRLPTALARIFQPFADIPPVTDVFYDVVPGDIKVLRGEDVQLAAVVSKGQPERMQAEITLRESGKTLWYELNPEGTNWNFTLSGMEQSFDYRIHGGGTWSRLHHVTMIDRPQIIELRAAVHFPGYMGFPEPRVNPPNVADVTGPQQSTVEIMVATAGDVTVGEIQLYQPRVRQVEVSDRIERVWFAEAIPDGAAVEGAWEWDLRLLARNAHTDPASPGQHRHLFHSAPRGHAVRPGESLFAHVYVVPDQIPETIMLEWHDGQGWEHRAFWGADKIAFGNSNTGSRRHLGPIPPAGEWTRLEIPAALVDLEGKTVKGMAFTLFGGKCIWHRAGSLPAQYRAEQDLELTDRRAMSQTASDQWAGRFPLQGTGYYRIELKNELGYPSKTMQEARYVAIPDHPPQIVVDRPGSDIVLSKPVKVPLAISAYDDFGLAKIVLAVQQPAVTGFESRPIRRYAEPVPTDELLHTLDLPAMNLKPGDVVKYRVEAHDRNEQARSTQEFSIRIQEDANSADRRLENFEKQQESLQQKFEKLVADQAKVEDKIEQLKSQNGSLTDKLVQAQAEAMKQAAAEAAKSPPPAPPKQPQPPPPPLALDEPTKQQLAQVRNELAQLATQEEQNANLSQQIAQELKASVEQAEKLELLPPQILAEVKKLPEQVQQEAVQPLQELTNEMKQSASPDKAPPDLPKLAEAAGNVHDDLAQLQVQFTALARAQQQARNDAAASVEKLRETMLAQQARSATKDLGELREFIQNLRKDLQTLEATESQLQEATQTVPELMLADVEDRQDKLEATADPKLDQVKELLANPGELPPTARPARPDSPYADPALAKSPDEDGNPQPADRANLEKPAFQPALKSGKKLDPPKQQLVKKPAAPSRDKPLAADSTTPEGKQKRQELGDRQELKMSQLEAAERSLGTDLETLSSLVDELASAAGEKPAESAMRGDPSSPPPSAKPNTAMADDSSPPSNTNQPAPNDLPQDSAGESMNSTESDGREVDAAVLAEILNSERLQEARAMAARLQASKNPSPVAKAQQNQPRNPGALQQPLNSAAMASQEATLPPSAANLQITLKELDLETRTLILKMQPRMREELLQGLREEGPEGYQKIIRTYFERLARVKAVK